MGNSIYNIECYQENNSIFLLKGWQIDQKYFGSYIQYWPVAKWIIKLKQ